MSSVFVVLSTYNGGPYLRPLIESIRRQSFDAWTLLVRDDGSSDETVRLTEEMAAVDQRIIPLDAGPRLGPYASFGLLMQQAYDRGAEYLLLADQDDVWHADKIERMLGRMHDVEAAAGRPSPQLVYSDLTVVDAELRMVHPSFLQHSRLRHGEGRPLRTLLGRCFVLGCASIANRPLLKLALPLPATVASHDWWLALCAASVGRVSHLAQSTLDYRRHDQNTSGPAGFWKGFNPLRHSWRRRWEVGFRSFERSIHQARSLRERLRERCSADSADSIALLDHFCAIFDRPGRLRRVLSLHGLNVPDIDLPRRVLYDLCVLRLPPYFPLPLGDRLG
ncbi:MAG: glycosyltransferase [Planctomycetaceae bacterium]|nr:glycosyltransferase [Planctomycetaceae bacterium]